MAKSRPTLLQTTVIALGYLSVVESHMISLDGGDRRIFTTDSYRLDWIGDGPETTDYVGDIKIVLSNIPTSNELRILDIDKEINLTYHIHKGSQHVKELNEKYQNAKGRIRFEIPFERSATGSVVFQEDLTTSSGRVRKTYDIEEQCKSIQQSNRTQSDDDRCNMREPEEFDFELTEGKLDEHGLVKGSYWVEYMGTDKYTHPKFYNLFNRTTEFDGALMIEEKIRSPFECAQRTIELDQYSALYNVKEMKCLIRCVDLRNGTIFDTNDSFIGPYNVPNSDKLVTNDRRERTKWISSKQCDIVHDGLDGKHYCKEYDNKPGSVLMFRRMSPRG